jgi:hypothetical protein
LEKFLTVELGFLVILKNLWVNLSSKFAGWPLFLPVPYRNVP